MKIPIQNIYYMLLYAWDALEEADAAEVAAEDATSLLDLFARVLVGGADRALRRGLDRGYVDHRESVAGVRGKLELAASIKSGELWRARSVCSFDELSYDVLHNQILKATVARLVRARDLDTDLRDQLAEVQRRLGEISGIELNEGAFRRLQLHRNNRHYRLLMDVCRLLHRAMLPAEGGEEAAFREFLREEGRMRRMFERFVRNFYRREQREYRVVGNDLAWAGLEVPRGAESLVPRMRTDIRLVSPDRRIIIETKFVPELLQQHHHGGATFRSAHLYQLLAYLTNLSAGVTGPQPEGILLYPATGTHWDVPMRLAGFAVRVRTVNLARPWRRVQQSLLEMIED